MANRRDIKRRILSVANTQKITKAMKLVSAAKFARAALAIAQARPYQSGLDDIAAAMVEAARSKGIASELTEKRELRKVLLVFVTSDRGLCGALNTNLFRAAKNWLETNEELRSAKTPEIDFVAWGRKGIAWAKRTRKTPASADVLMLNREKALDKPNAAVAKSLSAELIARFKAKEYDRIFIVGNRFINALTQMPEIHQLLPLEITSAQKSDSSAGVIVEPNLDLMFERLLERRLASFVFKTLLDGAASEHGSRMTAMDSATTNAGEVRKKLVLKYNRVRQAAITKELIEIISGAEAL